MKIKIYLFVSLFFLFNNTYSQCGASTACNTNTGIFSNNIATDIAYDNMGSAFHSTFIKETNGVWKVWGENLGNDGVLDVLNTQVFDAINYPILTGSIYKMAIGSDSIDDVQLIVLTSTGLFIVGDEGAVISNNLTNSNAFQKLTIDGQINGLPAGLLPEDIKMMFASTGTLILTTCSGNVYVLSTNANMRGNGVTTADQWYKVLENATTPLTNVIVARGNGSSAFALKADGTVWTWGFNTFLGNGTAPSTRDYATQVTLPAGLTGVKMIQTTLNNLIPSYYLLGNDKKVYALGNNSYGHLGDNSITTRTSWVNAKNPNGTIINDAAWISTNEHDKNYPGLAVIKSSGLIYTAGYNSNYMIGRLLTSNPNFLGLPNGLVASDVITFAEVGGHTCALIKQCDNRYGYVGHKINGSMGNGVSVGATTQTYDFVTPPVINVCGTAYTVPIISVVGPTICLGQNAIFNVSGFAGQTVTYSINNGSSQNIVLDANGTAVVTINNPTSAVTMTINQIGSSATCIFPVNITSTNNQNLIVTPNFAQVASICIGSNLSALPTTSINGITGTWS
ncbi:MAG: hypothetical protein H7174_05085, partial [Flavobacterium sp.]|nr:hypothetical protein [Flavobacterium sp.]